MVPVNILGSAKPKSITMPKTKASSAEPRYRIEPRCKKQEASNRKTDENLKAERNYKEKIRLRVVKAAGYLSENLRLHEATAMVPLAAPAACTHHQKEITIQGTTILALVLILVYTFASKNRGLAWTKFTRSRKILRVVKDVSLRKKRVLRAKCPQQGGIGFTFQSELDRLLCSTCWATSVRLGEKQFVKLNHTCTD